MGNPFIIGKRIYLRAFERTDIKTCCRWINNPKIAPFIYSGSFPYNEDRETKWFENLYKNNDKLDLGICLVEDDRLIGTCGLMRIDWVHRWATVGIILGEPETWGKGYGTEATGLIAKHAFESLNLRRLELGVFAGNKRAIKCYEKVGFEIEGTLKSKYYKNGEYVDEIIMTLFKKKWKRNQE